jgi:hypothetical protein
MADPTDTESPAESNEPLNGAQVGNELSATRDEANALLKAIKARAKAADVQGDSIQQAHASALSASEQLSTDLAASRAQLAELEQLAAAAAQTDAALATLDRGFDHAVDGVNLVVARRLASAVGVVVLGDDGLGLGRQGLPCAVAAPQLVGRGKLVERQLLLDPGAVPRSAMVLASAARRQPRNL